MTTAILKHRLYDTDRIISRTLAHAIVTGVLVGLYASLVLLATQVLGLHRSSVAVAVSTLATAALFSPLRRWVRQMVDRRFNRARYDADKTIAAFATRLKDTVDLDSVRYDLASVVPGSGTGPRIGVDKRTPVTPGPRPEAEHGLRLSPLLSAVIRRAGGRWPAR
jgi:hypothetical protein